MRLLPSVLAERKARLDETMGDEPEDIAKMKKSLARAIAREEKRKPLFDVLPKVFEILKCELSGPALEQAVKTLIFQKGQQDTRIEGLVSENHKFCARAVAMSETTKTLTAEIAQLKYDLKEKTKEKREETADVRQLQIHMESCSEKLRNLGAQIDTISRSLKKQPTKPDPMINSTMDGASSGPFPASLNASISSQSSQERKVCKLCFELNMWPPEEHGADDHAQPNNSKCPNHHIYLAKRAESIRAAAAKAEVETAKSNLKPPAKRDGEEQGQIAKKSPKVAQPPPPPPVLATDDFDSFDFDDTALSASEGTFEFAFG